MRRVISALAGLGGLVALLLALAAAALWWGQERLTFAPQPLPPGFRAEALGADVTERWVNVPGARLHLLQLQRPAPKALVLYLHGNAGNLASWFVNLDFWRAQEVDLVMPDYRGFGASGGRISSQAELQADMRAVWDAVVPAYQARGIPVVLMGRSLGTGLALPLAAALPAGQQPQALVLISPYESLQRLAAEHMPWVPGWLLRYPLRSDRALQALAAQPRPPALTLLHGSADTLIPPAHAQALARQLPAARLVLVAGAAHNDLQAFAPYLDAVRAAVAEVARR